MMMVMNAKLKGEFSLICPPATLPIETYLEVTEAKQRTNKIAK
jgi:hypothetical protein